MHEQTRSGRGGRGVEEEMEEGQEGMRAGLRRRKGYPLQRRKAGLGCVEIEDGREVGFRGRDLFISDDQRSLMEATEHHPQ